MIREATEADIPQLLSMGAKFAVEARLHELSGYDPASVEALFRHLITDPMGILLMAEGGAAGGLVHPALFRRSHLTGMELFWWMNPESRGAGKALFLALEQAARDRGAHSWTMATITGLGDDRLGQLYERHGYRATDRNYLKVF